ncbi:hypothetical protein DAERI_100007 [Deinococcus aerius]|uniref:Uncharacterized protein n=1 Tax=Deinococcus aerius TaxID=200253 RepID=A0A2I9CX48_9DEIO|nr:hypothetical protein [Deinococcus aerius]GBF06644.1 hypothetical protein DAERI_100007 [Deinococcus aerius]
MNDNDDRQDHPQEDTGTPTEHGRWTPEVSEAADREMRELLREDPGTEPATEGVDKSDLSLPRERRPVDH